MTAKRYQPGDHLTPLIKPPVSKIQLVKYSGASGDFNPIHTVEEFAKAAGLGGVIAHGMLTMGFVAQMLTDEVGEAGELLSFGVRFVDMVRPGDIITCDGVVQEVKEEEGYQVVTCDVWAQKSPGDVRVVQGTATFRKPLA
ncbi:MaoC family dehydratase N-terminal domain-containing protein [Alicyclobacillus mali]|uniref:MaoC family dehydratase N-terminal domain-containing protein n=1 Tax=Alicyclobacillus mali (ex Roth et al. 2021) TaxID=1123961 RepID=A0ABS0F018_9BACL|nr:MaoC/PaaZ C-terminal domain-containing protein [Alicyclobacillus mali (ex Roth et al. 2021)]MBF8376638.1 MaoC family dehydratase N-terminal domain-containing protein [Alicyclobacillus mali (ex Roth et al. 2021)]